jgi:hypothetical protein
MSRRHPPRLALAVLERLVPDSASLAGDLAEEFDRRQSSVWIWWQVLAAIATAWIRRPDDIRPLRLVELQPSDAQERARRFGLRFKAVNLTASPVPGVGGLGLVALALIVTMVTPATWLVPVASMAGGVALGLALIALRGSRRFTGRHD